jgi:predicted  nucleic acid-binding Zn-ribbon protein
VCTGALSLASSLVFQTKDTLSDTQSRLKAKTLDYVRLQDRLDASETKRIEAEKQLAAVTEEVESLTLQVRL